MKPLHRLLSMPRSLLLPGFLMFGQLIFLVVETKPWTVNLFARMEEGERLGFREFYAVGMWYGTLASFLILGVLLFTSRWWRGPSPRAPVGPGFRAILTRHLCLGLGLAMLLGAWDRAPRLTHSLTNDEEYSMRSYVLGSYQVQEDGSLRHRPLRAKETFFDSPRAANHTLYSLTARWGLAVTDPFLASEEQPWSEVGLRLPAFIAGLLAIGMMGLVFAAAGYPGAGVAAAFLLALHPWHLRYAAEARGYAFLIFFVLLALAALIVALRTNQWRHWLLYGAAQCLYLMSFLASVYLAVIVNLLAIGVIFLVWRPAREALSPFTRLMVANLVGAAVFVQLQTVQLLQLRYSLVDQFRGGMDARSWFYDLWIHAAAGIRWPADDPDFPLYLAMENLVRDNPLMSVFFQLALPILVIIGAAAALIRSAGLAIAIVAPVLAAGLAFGHGVASGTFLWGWYCLYVMVAFVAAYAMGLDTMGRLAPQRVRPWLHPAVLTVGVLIFAAATSFPRSAIRDHPRQPMREAVELARGDEYPAYLPVGHEMLTASFGVSARQLQAYDPRIHPLDRSEEENMAGLKELMRRAEQEGKPLMVIYAGRNLISSGSPELLALVEESGRFEEIGLLPGLEKMFTYRVARLLPME